MIRTRTGTRIKTRVRGGHFAAAAAPPEDFVDAVVLAAAGLPAGPLTWFGASLAPPETPLPYACFAEPDESDRLVDTSGTKEARGTIDVRIFATGKKEARGLGDQLTTFLEGRWSRGKLRFSRGHLFWFLGVGRTCFLDPDPAPDGGPVFVEVRQFEFRYTYLKG